MSEEEKKVSLNFIEQIIENDLAEGKYSEGILTRFPPEPNGYLHIGHCKAIWINFEMARKYGGKTNLRFDDTNPTTEETSFVDAIQNDIKWLGYEWNGEALFASDYFEQLYQLAHKLIDLGLAYVDDGTSEEIASLKGSPSEPGTDSPYRNRSIEENKRLFTEMKEGKYPDGSRVLRAKIDMSSPNMLMRDPLIYRIKNEVHHRTGDKWCIYPMYDFAHGQSDAIENISHSLCSLEFIHHRPVYDWLIEKLDLYPSRQYEFARMNVSYMITSKRKLLKLVNENLVSGWDDPRMPTVAGMRRRGYPASAIRKFCEKTGVAKRNNLQDISLLESCVKEELNRTASRVMVVMDPVKLVITNYPEDKIESLSTENNPEDSSQGSRSIPFTRELLIERNDFMEDAPKKYFRLTPGKDVRLKGGYIVHCTGFKNDDEGNLEEVHCTYYENSKSGEDVSGVRAKGTIHWVSKAQALPCEVREYDRLFTVDAPGDQDGKDFLEFYNENSLRARNAFMEPVLENAEVGRTFQFMRIGYFCVDRESSEDKLVFNRTVTLRDSWAKSKKK